MAMPLSRRQLAVLEAVKELTPGDGEIGSWDVLPVLKAKLAPRLVGLEGVVKTLNELTRMELLARRRADSFPFYAYYTLTATGGATLTYYRQAEERRALRS